jgi:hypothetical protein
MKRNDYYNLRPFYRKHIVIGCILSIIYLVIYPLMLFIVLFGRAIKESLAEIPREYKTLVSYIKFCFNKKIED